LSLIQAPEAIEGWALFDSFTERTHTASALVSGWMNTVASRSLRFGHAERYANMALQGSWCTPFHCSHRPGSDTPHRCCRRACFRWSARAFVRESLKRLDSTFLRSRSGGRGSRTEASDHTRTAEARVSDGKTLTNLDKSGIPGSRGSWDRRDGRVSLIIPLGPIPLGPGCLQLL
jgi:hypothetical protein